MKKLERVVYDIYIKMYAEAEPPADFLNFIENGQVDDTGKIVIPFDNHVLSESRQTQIIDEICRNNRIKGREKELVSRTVFLGCSPRFKQETQ